MISMWQLLAWAEIVNVGLILVGIGAWGLVPVLPTRRGTWHALNDVRAAIGRDSRAMLEGGEPC